MNLLSYTIVAIALSISVLGYAVIKNNSVGSTTPVLSDNPQNIVSRSTNNTLTNEEYTHRCSADKCEYRIGGFSFCAPCSF